MGRRDPPGRGSTPRSPTCARSASRARGRAGAARAAGRTPAAGRWFAARSRSSFGSTDSTAPSPRSRTRSSPRAPTACRSSCRTSRRWSTARATGPRAATADGEGETVYAMVQMVAGGNAHELVGRVKERLAEISKRLPPGVTIEPFYDRAALVDRVLGTVRRSLLEGGAIVVAVLFLLLGDVGAGLVVATAIPLSMLGAFALMRVFGMSGNLMSLGAIDFGLVVDGAVVVVEGALAGMTVRAIERAQRARPRGRDGRKADRARRLHHRDRLRAGAPARGRRGEDVRADGVDRALRARHGARALVHVDPCARLDRSSRKASHHEVWVVRQLRRAYVPALDQMLTRPRLAAAIALGLALLGVAAAYTRGSEFVPRLEEGDLVVQVTRPPSVSVEESVRGTLAIEKTLQALSRGSTRGLAQRQPRRRDRRHGDRAERRLRDPRASRRVALGAGSRGARRPVRQGSPQGAARHRIQLDAADRDARRRSSSAA